MQVYFFLFQLIRRIRKDKRASRENFVREKFLSTWLWVQLVNKCVDKCSTFFFFINWRFKTFYKTLNSKSFLTKKKNFSNAVRHDFWHSPHPMECSFFFFALFLFQEQFIFIHKTQFRHFKNHLLAKWECLWFVCWSYISIFALFHPTT